MAEVEALQERIRDLERQLADAKCGNETTARKKISDLSSEVVDTNPYR